MVEFLIHPYIIPYVGFRDLDQKLFCLIPQLGFKTEPFDTICRQYYLVHQEVPINSWKNLRNRTVQVDHAVIFQ